MSKKYYLVIFLMLLITVPVFANEPGMESAVEQDIVGEISPHTYGPDSIYMWIPAADFKPRETGQYGFATGGYIWRDGGTAYFTAGLNLPAGANLDIVRLYYRDINTDYNVNMYIYRFYGADDFELLGSVGSVGTPGYGNVAVLDMNHTINNLSNQYVVLVSLSSAVSDFTLGFKGVRVFYNLQISPSPVSATFSDVPTSHPLFQYIEALADSGITVGYADGTFRPSEPVLRGQMAAFLARALGLHW